MKQQENQENATYKAEARQDKQQGNDLFSEFMLTFNIPGLGWERKINESNTKFTLNFGCEWYSIS